jgi:hypothetical protein
MHPNTAMLPENATPTRVADATNKRRLLSKLSPSPHAKKVRKTEPQWLGAIAAFQEQQREQVTSMKTMMENSNQIQKERNQLLQKLLEKL